MLCMPDAPALRWDSLCSDTCDMGFSLSTSDVGLEYFVLLSSSIKMIPTLHEVRWTTVIFCKSKHSAFSYSLLRYLISHCSAQVSHTMSPRPESICEVICSNCQCNLARKLCSISFQDREKVGKIRTLPFQHTSYGSCFETRLGFHASSHGLRLTKGFYTISRNITCLSTVLSSHDTCQHHIVTPSRQLASI